jgi:outer membrane receptor protein involved in Fe transport
MSKKIFRDTLLASTVIASMTAFTSPAFAQDAGTPAETTEPQTAAQDQQAEETSSGDIVVTGTLIRNPNLVSSSPVTVVGEDEIDLQQSNVAEELLRELPGVVPSIGSAVNNGNGGASFVNLRGLGSNRNLVLIDGVRLVPATLQGQFDLNNIPVALIERVDALTGGASTTYGADAVTGVVNFITRSDFTGIDLSASNSITEEGDGHIFRVDATIGANFDDGRGNVVMSIGYQEADPVYQGARDVSIFNIDTFTGNPGGSGTAVPTRFTGVRPVAGVAPGTRQINPEGTAFQPTAAFTAFNFNPYNIFQTPFERFNIYGAGSYEVSDGIEFYTRGLFSKNTVQTIIAPSGSFGISVQLPLNNPFLTPALRNAFCAGNANIPQAACDAAAAPGLRPGDANYREVTTGLFRRAIEAGPRTSDYVTTFFDYRAGIRGSLTETLSYDLFGSYGESENVSTTGGYLLNSRIRQGIRAGGGPTGPVCFDTSNDCVPVNFFGPPGSISQEAVDFLVANSTVNTFVSLAQARGTVSGDFGFGSPLAEEPIGFAIGGEYREYRASQISDLLASGGDLAGAGGASPNIEGGFNVYEAFAELIAPLIADRPFFELLQLEAGYRRSDYTVDAPGNPSFATDTYKVGGKWEPFQGLQVRGSYARAVRAPNIGELFSPVNTGLTSLADDPCANLDDQGVPIPGRPVPTGELRAICLAQGATPAQIGQITVPIAGQANVTGGGNLNLLPETADTYTIGAIFQPTFVPGLAITVDYYNIKVKGAVSSPTPGDVITACFGGGAGLNPPAGASQTEACTSIRRDPLTGALSGDPATTPGLPATLSNLGRISTDGIDAVISYRRDFGDVGLSVSAQGNYTFSQKFQATPSAVNRECVGLYSENCSFSGSLQPEFQWSVRTTATFGDVDVSLLWRHIDRMEYEFAADDPAFSGTLPATVGKLSGKTVNFNRIPAYDYFDLTTRFQVTENFSLVLLVENLLDKEPPLVGANAGSIAFNSGNTYPSTYDALGRTFTATARLKF